VAARSGQVPRPGLTEIDPRGPVLLGVCVWVRGTCLISRIVKCFLLYIIYISFIRDNSALCLPSPIIVINKSLLLNVPARFCVSFIGLARCVLRDSEGKLFIWSGAALVTPLGYAGSESAKGVVPR